MLAYTQEAATVVRALQWHDETALQRLTLRLQEGLAEWACEWGLSSPEWTCLNAWDAPQPDGASWRPVGGEGDERGLWLGQTHEALVARLCMALYGESASIGSLAHTVAAKAAQALLPALAEVLAIPAANGTRTTLPEACWRPWSGAVHAGCRVAGGELCSLLIWPQQQPVSPPQAAVGGLVPLAMALTDHALRVRVTLEDVPLRLGELLAMSPGDVLVTPHGLTQPLQVNAASNTRKTYFSAHLGQHDGRMAVTLIA